MAKYKIIPSSRTIVQSPISIGHKAEKGVEAIEFDLTAWVETYGSGTATIVMKRWGDSIPYPVALEIDENNKATWTLSDIDTAKAGMAYAQLNYIVGDEVVKKSDIYTFRVMDSLTGEGDPPEAYESWLEHLTHLAAEAMAEVLDIEGIVTDKTLTVDGGIADAKATGDALSALEDAVGEETDKLKANLSEIDDAKEYTSEIGNVILELLKKLAYIDEDTNQYIEELANLIESGKSGRVGDEELRSIIFDTDFMNVDDFEAIRLVATAVKSRVVNLAGIILSETWGNIHVQAFSKALDYEGLGNFDFGINKSNIVDTPTWSTADKGNGNFYSTINNGWSYGKYNAVSEAEDAVTYYRKLLSSQKGKTDILAIGSFATIYMLLQSNGDSISSLTGLELVRNKVGTIYTLGGFYPTGKEWNFSRSALTREASAYVCENCPVPIVFTGLGRDIHSGAEIAKTIGTNDLLYKSIIAHDTTLPKGSYYNIRSWDAFMTLIAIYGEPSLAGCSLIKGKNFVDTSTGTNTFVADENGKDSYIVQQRSNGELGYEIDRILIKKSY